MKKQTICICGGGNLAHVVGGFLAAKTNGEVSLLTRHPERWNPNRTITVSDNDGGVSVGKFSNITSDPQIALTGADIVLFCLPGYAIAEELEKIKPYLQEKQIVGSVVSSTGFFLMAKRILPSGTPLFGFQRVPFIARVDEYGNSASLLGYKQSLYFATDGVENPGDLSYVFSSLFDIPVYWLDNFLKVTLTNSNPLLHPSRLFGMFGTGVQEFENPLLFYEDWDDFSSEIYIACDIELHTLMNKLHLSEKDIPTILSYYESEDAATLTKKIRSIKAFKGLLAPMRLSENGKYVPDYANRYFTEDIPFGLLLVKAFAEKMSVSTPTIDKLICWAQSVMGKDFLVDQRLEGRDVEETIVKYIL